MSQIVCASRDVPAGVALSASDLTLSDWPATVPLPGAFKKFEDVVGRPVIYPLDKGEPVIAKELGVPGSGIGLSVKIPPGMRATSVRSNEVTGVAGFLFPGSHVDVLATFNIAGNADPVTETLLQNVEVLTAGEQVEPDPAGKPQTVNVVTLLLSPEDSEKLLMASSQSTLQFVLRNGSDVQNQSVRPTRLNELIGAARPAPAAQKARRPQAVAAPKPLTPVPSDYVVEVIQGQTRTEQKFPTGAHPDQGGTRQ